MERVIPLSTGIGELMAPQTLVAALILTPDGHAKLDAGALHGRSDLESQLTWVTQRALVAQGQSYWIVWVAIELDAVEKPVRYKGLSACEMVVNPKQQVGYKSLAEHVNRMSEAMRGGINLTKLKSESRALVQQQLIHLSQELWDHSSDLLKKALAS